MPTKTEDIRPEERVLDWTPKPDERSDRYLLTLMAPQVMEFSIKPLRNRRWTRKAWLDQGREGACTGFGAAHVISATPRSHLIDEGRARIIYLEAQHRDEWPGNAYEGSSVNGAMKASRDMGLITEWWWAQTRQEIDAALSHYGQVEIGVPWMTGMFRPDSEGFIDHSGVEEGGHALALAGRRLMPNGRVRYELDQSWGRDHGRDGTVFIWEETLEFWLDQRYTEFALPRKVLHRA